MNEKGIKPTAIRLLVLKTIEESTHPLSLLDLENRLETVDRSSIFRAITLFLDRHLLHAIDDGSGSLKYELCKSRHDCTPEDQHIHFHCEACKQTFCLESLHTPLPRLPEGFRLHSINYVLKGLCPTCAARQKTHPTA